MDFKNYFSKFLLIFIILFLTFFTGSKAYACSPSFPALWPPSITSTESTEHTAGITWSMGLPFIGDITAYRIYLNGNLVHTISPNITSLMFNPAGHGSYSVSNLQPATNYTLSVGVVFAIPVGCGITWKVEMKSSASVITKPLNWNQQNIANAMNGTSENINSITQSSKPYSPVLSLISYGVHSAEIKTDLSGSYVNNDFTQKEYPINSVTFIIGDSCNPAAYQGYNSAYYSNYKGYDTTGGGTLCTQIEPYEEKVTGSGKNRNTEIIYRYVLNKTTSVIKKTIYLKSSGTVSLILPEGDVRYVIYAYSTNSNGDNSDMSNPVIFVSKQGKTITIAGENNANGN